MSKRHPVSIENVQSWLERGDGQGELLDFMSFFNARDVPSRGRTRWLPGVFIMRQFVTFSDLEYYNLILAEYAAFAGFFVDIREQVALVPWELPQRVAEQYGIRYPRFPGTKIPYLMSSDLVLTIPTAKGFRLLVLCVKSASELAHGDKLQEKHRQRTLEKLFIEWKFWSLHGAEWVLSTEKMLPMILVKNLDFTRPALIGEERTYLTAMIPDFVKVFLQKWSSSESLVDLNYRVSASFGISIDDAFALFGRAIWLRQLPADIHSHLLHHDRPVTLTGPLGPCRRELVTNTGGHCHVDPSKQILLSQSLGVFASNAFTDRPLVQ